MCVFCKRIIGFISKHEKFLTLLMVFIQTTVVCIGVYLAIKEFRSDEMGEQQKKSASSWDIYKSNKLIENDISQFLEHYLEIEKAKENTLTSSFFDDKNTAIGQMYAEFEICISLNRCDEDVLIFLACNNALRLADYAYQNDGVFSFVLASSDENFKKYNLNLNLYRFAKRCLPIADKSHKLLWKEELDKLAM